ncbi:hypothetical protein EVAR_36769_1 [Eumeta japonica]|uniref:Uncharacterized protein n=1 Tax=Eumeta variegata TaxID=151549 RepID=A0A4C1X099_EUMVA|nr:hypothetical protein EVAR_36769_1 [Eumeta japonica]
MSTEYQLSLPKVTGLNLTVTYRIGLNAEIARLERPAFSQVLADGVLALKRNCVPSQLGLGVTIKVTRPASARCGKPKLKSNHTDSRRPTLGGPSPLVDDPQSHPLANSTQAAKSSNLSPETAPLFVTWPTTAADLRREFGGGRRSRCPHTGRTSL